MENKFTNDEFERFLRQSADSCRMRPSEDVWKGVSKNLNERKRRVRFATGFFLLAASLMGYFLVDSSKDINRTIASASAEVSNNSSYTSKETTSNKSTIKKAQAIVRRLTPKVSTLSTSGEKDYTLNNPLSLLSQQRTELAPVIPLYQSIEPVTTIAEEQTSAEDVTSLALDPAHSHEQEEKKVQERSETTGENDLLSIESVTNAFRGFGRKSKFSFQVFFTPTVSYRKLSENKAYLNAVPFNPSAPVNIASFYDINNAVTHKPDMGLELGFAVKYPVTKGIKVKGGMQFNMNRYDIRAFNYMPEVATIALNTGANRVSYVGSVTNYRNFGGNSTDWLQNLYLQASAPVGIEVKLHGNQNIQFGIGSTIQPTYVLSERAYLLSSDYKNYTEVPSLTRRWNVNTSFETYVSYSTGKMNWQVGPQVRYQLLSSFVTKYPVKENLFDFGLKVGVSMNKPNDK